MNTEQIEYQTIRNSLFDESKRKRIEDTNWRIGSEAANSGNQFDQSSQELMPASYKLERASALPTNYEVILGGLCSIFTGDLAIKSEGGSLISRVRMDQIVEAVGGVQQKPSFVVVEDEYFAAMTDIPLQDIQRQGITAVQRIERWLQLSRGNQELLVVNISDKGVGGGLKDAVQYMANDVLQNPNFARIQAAPILLMYTSLWSDLLYSLGKLPSPNVVCVEPVVHFVDDRRFPEAKLENAYCDFLEWLRENPYAKKGSENSSYGIAGFLESVTGDERKKRMRLLPYAEVPNTENVCMWTEKLNMQADMFPFPLRNNLLFAEAVNWGLWNEIVRTNLLELVSLEQQYYQEREGMPKAERNQNTMKRLRNAYEGRSKKVLQDLAMDTNYILTYVLGAL